MEKKYDYLILLPLVIFSIYCSLILGMAWDEPYFYEIGINRLKYILSFGNYEYREFSHGANIYQFPGFYDTLTAFISQMIPKKYEIETHHLINLFFSFITILGITKITKSIFNSKVSKIVFLILFLNPIFFGHMSINTKDTIIAFSNVWATYFIIRYLQTQSSEIRRKHFSMLIGIAIGFGIGSRIISLATFAPIFILIFLDIFFIKIIRDKKFSINNFFKDFLKIFLIVYFIMIIFWPNVHSNIFILPFKFFLESLNDTSYGIAWGFLDGEIYKTINTPRLYLLINLFYKLPEYLLFTYIIFIYLFFKEHEFFENHFKFFKIKISYLIFIILFPLITVFIAALKITDGLRYFLFLIPYLSIIPGLVIYYLIYNSKLLLNKFFIFLVFISFLFFLFNFFSLTPYHYVYLNKFNGDFSEASKKFENDYWGTSIKELVNKMKINIDFEADKNYKIAFCGINHDIAIHYLKKINNFSFTEIPSKKDYDYIIMTNRINGQIEDKITDVKSCFDLYKGKDILSVKRNGLILSTVR